MPIEREGLLKRSPFYMLVACRREFVTNLRQRCRDGTGIRIESIENFGSIGSNAFIETGH